MNTIECILTRRSKRELHRGEVKRDVIEKIVDCGRMAPTANNLQPCEFIAVTDKQKLKKLSKIAVNGPFIENASFCIIIFAKDVKYYLEDGCAATENVLLAIHSFGLSACWVAGDKKDYAKGVAEELNVPPKYKLISIIPAGNSDDGGQSIKKRNLSEVIHWEKF